MDIKSVLKKYGETTYTLAEKMGISQPSMHSIVNGNPTVKKLEQVAKALGCSPAEFFQDWQTEQHDELPFDGGQQQEQASEKATSEQVLRFSYDCPHCGHEVRITIE